MTSVLLNVKHFKSYLLTFFWRTWPHFLLPNSKGNHEKIKDAWEKTKTNENGGKSHKGIIYETRFFPRHHTKVYNNKKGNMFWLRLIKLSGFWVWIQNQSQSVRPSRKEMECGQVRSKKLVGSLKLLNLEFNSHELVSGFLVIISIILSCLPTKQTKKKL